MLRLLPNGAPGPRPRSRAEGRSPLRGLRRPRTCGGKGAIGTPLPENVPAGGAAAGAEARGIGGLNMPER